MDVMRVSCDESCWAVFILFVFNAKPVRIGPFCGGVGVSKGGRVIWVAVDHQALTLRVKRAGLI